MRKHIRTLADIDSRPAPHQQDGRLAGQNPGHLLSRFLAYSETGGEEERKKKLTAGRRAVMSAAVKTAGSADVREMYKIAYERWEKRCRT